MRMSVCFLPIDVQIKISTATNLKFRYTSQICIPCKIGKDKLMEIIQFIFIKYKFSTIGYNKKLDEFHGKKSVRNVCILHFTVSVHSVNNNVSNLVITPLAGNDLEIKKIIYGINNTLQLYQSHKC